jgi:hypothetical protein
MKEPGAYLGLAEVAEILGVAPQTAEYWTKTPGFPEALDRLRMGTLWRRVDVEAYAEEKKGGDKGASNVG